ncbi:uncharacterized protein BDV14DRAFT_197347 [Aspergillus stella-maris]|uniref:uncharacterized protein n=1 Tax=Aspergillus stella-maris TaxID=1810926 RepID=UPI003CCCF81B
MPSWQVKATAAAEKYMDYGVPFTLAAWEEDFLNAPDTGLIDFNKDTTEDCLFLDVHVPETVFGKARRGERNASVLVFVCPPPHPPHILQDLAADDNEIKDPWRGELANQDMIYVAPNCRLGALGWLAGPEVESDGNLNAGLLDQRLALK